MPNILRAILVFALLWGSGVRTRDARADQDALVNPILFVTQMPIPDDFTTANSVFGNHLPTLVSVGRGGDLWIRYADGTLRNLTQAAGFGSAGLQGANAIAVRDPAVHWDGKKALFSMVIGAPTKQYEVQTYFWQMYEVSGFGVGETVVITRVPNQPANFNNISPIYGTDDRIIFTTDRPRNGATHLYPQLDEYEEAPTVTGLWSLDPKTGDLFMLNHAPSGAFTPIVDSFGRVVFTRWDHLQRDQQADTDAESGGKCGYCTFNYSDESATATKLTTNTEVFPEPRDSRKDLLQGTNLEGHSLNIFQPWQIDEDGNEEETLNHVGRHETQSYFNRSLTDDPNLSYFYPTYFAGSGRKNQNSIANFIQVKEDAARSGIYVGIDTPEFRTHASGQVISITGAPSVNADAMVIGYITHRDTESYTPTPSANHSGHYRDPLPMSDGTLVAAHTAQTDEDKNIGTTAAPKSRYDFRLKTLKQAGVVWVADQPLTSGISKTISFWNPDMLVTYSGNLWELQPAEVRAHARPARLTSSLAAPEQQAFDAAGVNLAQLQTYLRQNNLALMVTRNVTTRDNADRQQPFNLRVPGGVQSVGTTGKLYDVATLQVFQADQIRGLAHAGRRVLAQPLHDPAALTANATTSSIMAVAADGSMAAFVPARRALTWQLLDPGSVPVVRERYWLTFQPGEVRMCTSCHGLNDVDQANRAAPTNSPQALKQLLMAWKGRQNLPPLAPKAWMPVVRK